MEGQNLSELFKCPICCKIPAKEVYQCSNGHSICHFCSGMMRNCPTCRVSFATGRIRNRALEEVMDGLKFDCINKVDGCKDKLFRAVISTHASVCNFSPRPTNFCEQLGMPCPAILNLANSKLTMEHMKTAHNAMVFKAIDPRLWRIRVGDRQQSGSIFHSTIIITEDNVNGFFINCNRDLEQGNILFSCLKIGDNSILGNYGIKLSVRSPDAIQMPKIVSIFQPFDVKYTRFASQNPCLRVPASYTVAGHLTVYFQLVKPCTRSGCGSNV